MINCCVLLLLAVLATWKKAVIGTFVLLIILAAIGICAYLHTDKKKKGKDTDDNIPGALGVE